jgi:dihydroorotate dehydrogenase (fumarate)
VGEKIEKEFLSLVKSARKQVRLPLSVKMGSFYSSLSNLMHDFDDLKVEGLVLFNRFFPNDIDIDKIGLTQGSILSTPSDYLVSLRWTALMSAELNCDICASGGIYEGKTVVKQLLAGAKACALCSSVMKQGFGAVPKMLAFLSDWMENHNYKRISDFQGILAQEHMAHPEFWERSQYMKALQVEGV